MAFPTTSVLEQFNRADELPIVDPPWTALSFSLNPNMAIVSNTGTSNTSSFGQALYTNSGSAVYAPQTGSGIEIFFTLNVGAAQRFGLELLTVASSPPTDTPNGYEIDINRASNVWRVKRTDAGVNTTIGADITQAVATGDKVGCNIYKSGSDTIIDVYYKAAAGSWGLLATRTDTGVTTHMVNSYIGAYVQDNANNSIDDFGGGNAVSGLTAAQMRPAFAQATENSNAMIGRVWE